MDFQMMMYLVVIWLMNIMCIIFLFTTIAVGKKHIGQFKCNYCGKFNKKLMNKCSNCGKTMGRNSYRYKSTFFGRVSIKDADGIKVLTKAIKWISIDFTITLMLTSGLSTILYFIHTR